jgi:flagellar basal-body rod modification protein FlgD
MSALISGIFGQHATANSVLKAQSVNPQAAASTSSSASDSATISANDFLTLLVTEMKNQDPTANTDPNEYINQLVQVNSLEQLISINQTLTSDTTATPASGIVRDPTTSQVGSALNATQPAATATSTVPAAQQGVAGSAQVVQGNLAVHGSNPAAQRVAESLTVPSYVR